MIFGKCSRHAIRDKALSCEIINALHVDYAFLQIKSKALEKLQNARARAQSCMAHLAPKLFQQMRTMFFLANLLYYFDLFATFQNQETIATSSHIQHIPATQFVLPL